MIAALYFALSVAFNAIAFGPVQFRVSEILVLLPLIFPEAIPGLAIGCFFTNFFFSPFGVFDMVLGTLATLIGAIGTYLLRRRPFLATIPPIVANTLLVPLIFVLNDASTVYYLAMFEILASQIITCIVLGMPFTFALKKAMIAAHIPLPHPSKYDTAPYRRILPGVEEDEEGLNCKNDIRKPRSREAFFFFGCFFVYFASGVKNTLPA